MSDKRQSLPWGDAKKMGFCGADCSKLPSKTDHQFHLDRVRRTDPMVWMIENPRFFLKNDDLDVPLVDINLSVRLRWNER